MSAPALFGPDSSLPRARRPRLGSQQTLRGQGLSTSGTWVRTDAAEAASEVGYGQGTESPEEGEGQIPGTRTSVAFPSLVRARVTVRASPSNLSGLLCRC